MGYEICSLSSFSSRAVGAGGGSLARCGLFANLWSPRRFGSPALSVDFLSERSLCKGLQGSLRLVRHRSVRKGVVAVHASQQGQGFFGALTGIEKPCCSHDVPPEIGNGVLESWLERSLPEIVRHLPEAPFLQYVFKSSHLGGDSDRQRVSEELFDKPDSWGSVRKCLLEAAPDGLILVHRLDQDALSECCMNETSSATGELSWSKFSLQAAGACRTDVWGVLVHGCSMQCSNACYILKTTQVASSTGILTHFCVSRAKCFGPSLKSQMQSTWLL